MVTVEMRDDDTKRAKGQEENTKSFFALTEKQRKRAKNLIL